MGELIRRRHQFDVALFHAPNGDAVYASCLLGGILGWKTVYKMTLYRSDDLVSIRDTGRFGRLRLSALRIADGFISMSNLLTQTFEQTGLRPTRLLAVPQGVDTARFRPPDPEQKRAARARLGIPESARVALFCGSLIHRKGADILVEAWRQVARSVPHGLLLMVGPNPRDGLIEPQERPFSESIMRRIDELALHGSVRLFGFQKQVEISYAAADVFVFPSRCEGWGNVVTEAMAAGLPCIISRLDGISAELLRDGDEGIIVGSEDPGEYAEQLVRLLTDAETARQMGERARKRAVELFEIELVADRYAGFLRSFVTESPSDVREVSRQWS
jgi:glycosyltransferase involved in cell wall biosynthesis